MERSEQSTSQHSGPDSAQDWQSTFDSIDDLIAIIGMDRRIQKANLAMKRAFGRNVEGELCCRLVHGTESPPSTCPSCSAFDNPAPAHFELQEPNLDNRWFSIRVFPICDKDGQVTRIAHTMTDITGRKLAESYSTLAFDALRALNEATDLREGIESALQAIRATTGCDAVGVRLESQEDSPYFIKFGFSEDFVKEENTLVEYNRNGQVCRDADGNVGLECTCGLILSGKTDPASPLFTTGGSFWTNDSLPLQDRSPKADPRLPPRNRCIHDGFASVALIPIRQENRIVGLLQLSDRETNRFTLSSIEALEGIALHIGAALQRSELRNQMSRNLEILNETGRMAKVGGWEFTVSSQALQWTDEVRNIHEVDSDHQPSVESALNFYTPEARPTIQAAMEAAIARGEPFDLELDIVTAKGNRRVVHAIGQVDRTDDEAERIWGAFQDITDRKAMEEQIRQSDKMNAIGQLAGGVAHDFNNQLAGVLGYGDMLAKRLDDPNLKRYAENICTAARRSSDLTKKLLAFSRKGQFQNMPVDIHKVLQETVDMLHHSIDKRIRIRQNYNAETSLVMGDPSQIQNAFLNLSLNARDAMPEGGTLSFETDCVSMDSSFGTSRGYKMGEGKYISISIADTGRGIPESVLPHIFEPFYTTKAEGKGTGMGLAAVYGTVKQHKGCIDVSSEGDTGTTFHVYLPVSSEVREDDVPEAPGAKLTKGLTVMVVDDEKMVRELAIDLLSDEGHSVIVAKDGQEGVELYRKKWKDIDLVILDMIMPELDGRDAFLAMKSINPEIRAFLASGYSLNEQSQSLLAEGIQGLLMKPFDTLQLLQCIKGAVAD